MIESKKERKKEREEGRKSNEYEIEIFRSHTFHTNFDGIALFCRIYFSNFEASDIEC